MIYYSGSPVEKSSNLIMLLRYTKKKEKKRKLLKRVDRISSLMTFTNKH